MRTLGLTPLRDCIIEATTGFASGKRTADGVIQVRMNNLDRDCRWNWKAIRRVPTTATQLARCQLRPGDVLINTTNSADLVGRAIVFERQDEPVVFSNHFTRLRIDGSIAEPRFICRWLNHQWAVGRMALLSNRWVNQAAIRLDAIRCLRIPLPPLDEQRRIARLLDEADALRRKRHESLQLLDDLLQATFLDMFGDPVTNPRGWDVAALDTIADVASGVTKGRKLSNQEMVSVPYLRVANVQDGRLDLDDLRTIDVPPRDVDKYRLVEGDIVLTEGGDPDKLGRGAVWAGSVDPCIHQNHVFRVRCRDASALPEFISQSLRSPLGKRYFARAAKQTTGIASINKTQLSAAPVLLPPIRQQREWIAVEQRLIGTQASTKAAIHESDLFFESLLAQAFS